MIVSGKLKKKTPNLHGHLILQYGHVITGQQIPCFDSCQLATT